MRKLTISREVGRRSHKPAARESARNFEPRATAARLDADAAVIFSGATVPPRARGQRR
jgi:hypothetical protein